MTVEDPNNHQPWSIGTSEAFQVLIQSGSSRRARREVSRLFAAAKVRLPTNHGFILDDSNKNMLVQLCMGFKRPKTSQSVRYIFVCPPSWRILTEPTKIVTFTKDVGVTNIILDIDQGKLGYQQTRIGISITTYVNFTWPKLNGKELNKDAISATKRTDGYLAEVRYLSLIYIIIYIHNMFVFTHHIYIYTYIIIYICIQTCICMYMIHITHTNIRTYIHCIALHSVALHPIPFHCIQFH